MAARAGQHRGRNHRRLERTPDFDCSQSSTTNGGDVTNTWASPQATRWLALRAANKGHQYLDRDGPLPVE